MISNLLTPAALALLAAGLAFGRATTESPKVAPSPHDHGACSHGAGHQHGLACSSYVLPKTLQQLADESERIVLGDVVETRSEWHPNRRVIITRARVRVLDSLTGNTPETVEICTLGGRVGDLQLVVSEMRHVQIGERVALFLRWEPSLEIWVSTGGPQGVFSVVQQDGADRVVPSDSRLTLDSFGVDGVDLRGGVARAAFASEIRRMKGGVVR